VKVLAFAEQRNGKLKTSAFEVLTCAAKLAGGNPADVAVVIIGSQIEGLVSELKGFGADKAYVVDGGDFAKYNCLNYVDATASAVKNFAPELIVAAASPMGKDLMPRLAAKLDAGIISDVTAAKTEGGIVRCTKPMYAGKVLAKIAVKKGNLSIVTIRPNVFPAEKSNTGGAAPEKLTVPVNPIAARLLTKEIRKGSSEKPDLTEASTIISGGRAMANAENFKILHDCADVIGATVGASRAAVDSGYASHDMQVGQTGKTVNPNLYIACGISGSIQHMAGMRTSKVIVAINTDADAPIFGIATYGIVADLFQAVPLLTKKFKEML